MKYEINLLPPKAISDRMSAIKQRREITFFLATLVSFGIVLLSYGAIWWGLHSLQGSLAGEIQLRNKDRATIIQQSKELNKQISELDQRVSTYTLWTSYIPEILAHQPEGILISRIELVNTPETLVITGTATEGSQVVAYQTALEKLPWVDHVVAPLQNFARSPEAIVTFTIYHKALSEL